MQASLTSGTETAAANIYSPCLVKGDILVGQPRYVGASCCHQFSGGMHLKQLLLAYFRQLAALIQAGPPRAEFKGRVVKYLVVQKRSAFIGRDINRCRKGFSAGLRFKAGWRRR